MTEELFREDAYLAECSATVMGSEDNAVILDRTIFYPLGGGQPGDTGELVGPDGATYKVIDSRKGNDGILHVVEGDSPPIGAVVTARINWDRRHRLMRSHSAMHLLCAAVDGAVTGGQVGEEKSRLDFDLPDTNLDKETIAATINGWITEDRPLSARWISDEELDNSPDLVRTMSVRPPTGHGKVRLMQIEGVDLQACGGTHVRRTGEIGRIRIGKIENKGRHNRRINLHLEE